MDERPESGPIAPNSEGVAPEYEGTTPEYWRTIDDRRRLLATAGVVVLGIALVAVFVAWSILAHRAAQSATDGTQSITPAEDTSRTPPAADATDAVTATATPGAVGPGTAGPGGSTGTGAVGVGAGTQAAPGRVARVAYRRGGWLCVAEEDGSNERRIVASDSGVFALSPDGTVLAAIDDAGRTLVLVEVASGRTVEVGPAEGDRPAWAPDSSWLAYTAPGPDVRRVGRDGTRTVTLFAGSLPTVSSDGKLVVGASAPGSTRSIVVWNGSTVSRIPVSAPVSGLASDGVRIFYGLAPLDASGTSLHSVGVSGRDDRSILNTPRTTRTLAVCDLRLSPDGRRIAYAECGDDGYSRLFALPSMGGSAVPLTVRRDTYPLDWTADGDRVLFIEGNAFQGEATALLGVAPDGSARARLVEGAGR